MSGASLTNSAAIETTDKSERALKLQTDAPHLVSMGSDRLSTSVTIHPLPQGRVTLGSGPGVDILVQGTGVYPVHCHIENSEGVVTLYPPPDNLSIDGVQVTAPTRLSQGAMLTIGRSNYMRFNHPPEAKLMKAVLPNPRISMAPNLFERSPEPLDVVKTPPTVPSKKNIRESSSDSGGDGEDNAHPPSSFITKLSKFEYLASRNLRKSISPKVFPSNAVTVNTPARDVLGKTPPDIHNLDKNYDVDVVHSEVNANQKSNKRNNVTDGHSVMFSRKINQYENVILNENGNIISNRVIMFENDIKQLNSTDDTDFLQRMNAKKNINAQRVLTPSPGFNRTVSPYNYHAVVSRDNDRRSRSLERLMKNNEGSFEGNSEEMMKDAEIKRNQAQKDRIKEQELEKQEQARLEEILNMCAEYEKQSQFDKNKPITPNRIITNGSLPRDKRHQITKSPAATSPSSHSIFDFSNVLNQRGNSDGSSQNQISNYENHSFQLHRKNITSNYENVDFSHVDVANRKMPNQYPNVQYQTTPTSTGHYPTSPRTRIKTFVTSSKENFPKEVNVQNNTNENTFVDTVSDVSARKPTPSKFILPLEDPDLSDEVHLKNGPETKTHRSRYKSLKKEKQRLLDSLGNIKRLMGEVEVQEEELHIEMDMERALLSGEYKSKLLELDNLKTTKLSLSKRLKNIEILMLKAQHKQTEHERDLRQRLKTAQENVTKIENKLSATDKSLDEYEVIFEEYLKSQETLDCEKKSFEDLEFHHLEEEADWLATREELQREIADVNNKINELEKNIKELSRQCAESAKVNNTEYKSLENQKINYLVRLEKIRNKLKATELELADYSDQETEHEMSSDTDSDGKLKNVITDLSCSIVISNSAFPKNGSRNDLSASLNEKLLVLETGKDKKFPSQDDMDRISRVTSDSPIEFISANGKTIESLKDIERNRHVHLCQQGSQVIEHERQRVKALKEKAQQEIKNTWTKRIQDCSSIASTGSEDTFSLEQTDFSNTSKNELSEPLSSPEQSDGNRNENTLRPLSEMSEISLEGSMATFKKREKSFADKQRPLTRYLPIRSSSLDLLQHIESAGHQVVLCPHVIINSVSCRGFLHKKGSKLNGWSRRWFVFDRNRRSFSYYADKSERKARGGAYFQAIEEVYLDHAKSVKSPNPQLTFIVKTHERYYYLMAPSPEAMRIWVDVIFTGAEGYHEFDYNT